MNPIRKSNQPDNYRALVKKLIQLEPNDWSKFQEQLKNLHLAKIHQTEAQNKLKELAPRKKSTEITKEKHTQNLLHKHKPILQKNHSPAKQRLHKSSIHPLENILDRLKNFSPKKPEPIK